MGTGRKDQVGHWCDDCRMWHNEPQCPWIELERAEGMYWCPDCQSFFPLKHFNEKHPEVPMWIMNYFGAMKVGTVTEFEEQGYGEK